MAITQKSIEAFPISAEHVFADQRLPSAHPFVKWVGGKGQLLNELDRQLPMEVKTGVLSTYIEPFVGGGALFFHVAQQYSVSRFVIADSNTDLIIAYWTIRERVGQLIARLLEQQTKYLKLSESRREEFYYKQRDQFNATKSGIDPKRFSERWIERTTQLIFLNKTCFNGLFRVNSSGEFNVAFGRYEKPKICDPDNLVAVSVILKRAEILLCDFADTFSFVSSDSFIYLDPPYRPLTETANFTSYSPTTFTMMDQQRLALFCNQAHKVGAKILISNSDPANVDPTDDFFKQTYPDFRIVRTAANRMINCRADKRGKISELLMMNYEDDQRNASQR